MLTNEELDELREGLTEAMDEYFTIADIELINKIIAQAKLANSIKEKAAEICRLQYRQRECSPGIAYTTPDEHNDAVTLCADAILAMEIPEPIKEPV